MLNFPDFSPRANLRSRRPGMACRDEPEKYNDIDLYDSYRFRRSSMPSKPGPAAAPAKTGRRKPTRVAPEPPETVALTPTPPPEAARRPAKTAAARPDPRAETRRRAGLIKQAGDPTRLEILARLHAAGELHVGAISAAVGHSQPAVSHHLALLRHGRLLDVRRQGKNNYYYLSDGGRALIEAVGGL
jgi:DNA-binding transcriptional ArsR family regulator